MSRKTITVNHPSTPIESREHLEYYLYVAMQLEHATIPPYLTAAYTAQPEKNAEAIQDIVGVAREEMLHLSLAANMLNAIGGKPDLLSKDFVPSYPCSLPNGETDFKVSIEAFSDSAIQTFLNIERPGQPKDNPNLVQKHGEISYVNKTDLDADTRGQGHGLIPAVGVTGEEVELHYWSIGEFYNAIKTGFIHLTKILGEEQLFRGNPETQIDQKYFYSGGGSLIRVVNLESAIAAIDFISVQGEGYTDEIKPVDRELAHYYRFEQIEKGRYYYVETDKPHHPTGALFPRDYSAVFPIKKNAKVAEYENYTDIKKKVCQFNRQYKELLTTLNRLFNGVPEASKDDMWKDSYKQMFEIKKSMTELVRNQLPGTDENAAHDI